MSTLITNGYPIFTDKRGKPLEEGYIYIGEANLNPLSNPQDVFWDAELTIPASNIRTLNGYPVYQGSPARLYVAENYSILVQDKKMDTVSVNFNAQDFATQSDFTNTGFDFTEVTVKSSATITVGGGSTFDLNGTAVEIPNDVDLTVSAVDTDYYIHATASGAGATLSLETDNGIFDVTRNARYDGPKRVLNWVVQRDTTTSYVARIIDPANVISVEQSVRRGEPLEVGGVTADGDITNTGNLLTEGKLGADLGAYETSIHGTLSRTDIINWVSPLIPNNGDTVAVTGTYLAVSLSKIERISSTSIKFYGYSISGLNLTTIIIPTGSTTADVSIATIGGAP